MPDLSEDEIATESGVTRREALRRGGGFALAVGGAAVLGAGCGSSSQSTTAASAKPVVGGTLRYGTSSVPFGFDPPKWWSINEWNGELSVFDTLLTVSRDGRTLQTSLLSEPPTVTNGGTKYTFKLRSGVKFHHGRTMTADDVKFTIERIVLPSTESQGASLYTVLPIVGMQDVLNQRAKTLSGITVIDPQTLTITLEAPESSLLPVLTLPFAGIVPRDVVERDEKGFNTSPIGTGPFKIQGPVALDKDFTFTRNEHYWQPGKPYLDAVAWTIGTDPNLSALRILDGQQDMMFEPLPPATYIQALTNPVKKKQLVAGLANNVFYVTMSLKNPNFQDLRVRQAVAMAVDKNRLVRQINGLGVPGTGGLFSPLSPYWQPGLAYTNNVPAAKQLMAEAGKQAGFSVDLLSPNQTPYTQEALSIQQDLKAIGINVNPKIVDLQVANTQGVKNPPIMLLNTWELPYPHGSYVMDGGFTEAALKGGCCNFSNWVNGNFEKLAKTAHESQDPAQVVQLYKEMDRIVVRDEALWVPMFYPKFATLLSTRSHGYWVPSTPQEQARFFADYWLSA